MKQTIDQNATAYINSLPRIQSLVSQRQFDGDVLLLPTEAGIEIDISSNAILSNFNQQKDPNAKDILRIIEVHNAADVQYTETAVLSPSMYVHSIDNKPWHITTQCILVTHLSKTSTAWVAQEGTRLRAYYSKHEMDHFWLSCSKPLSNLSPAEPVFIMNRRVCGWDGSKERPVIELLGAGGHLQAIWNGKKFVSRDLKDNLKKEFSEEVGLDIQDDAIQCIGGFVNNSTHELVVLFCTFINESQLPKMQQHALGNFEEDTDGLYLGTFSEVISQYQKDPRFFAGGKGAAATNFPNNAPLMEKCFTILSSWSQKHNI